METVLLTNISFIFLNTGMRLLRELIIFMLIVKNRTINGGKCSVHWKQFSRKTSTQEQTKASAEQGKINFKSVLDRCVLNENWSESSRCLTT
jgi:hypothetical protein